ncbi:MAG: ABC transporter ATP-binding protein [Rothia sp. (in: high G+C Gram-positive bacteria)]|nr:ABC transporter ATP-binding protein [Rothia sp. (in: high G+C Gram-positive bacteria)]
MVDSSHSTVKEEKVKFRIVPPGFRWRPLFFLPFLLDILTSLALVFLPVLVGTIIDLHTSGDEASAWRLVWLLVGAVIYLSIVECVGWGITFRVTARIERDWRLYISHLISASPNRDTGALIAILNKDAKSLASMWQPMILAFSAVGVTALGTWQLWRISPAIAVVALGGLILTMLTLTWISKILEKHADLFREKVGVSTSRASDIASSIRTILGLGAQRRMMDRYGATAQDVYTSQIRLESVQTWSYAVRNFLVGAVTWVVIALALRGAAPEGAWITEVPAGQLVTVVGLINTLSGPIWSVEMLLFSWRTARVSLKRIDKLAAEVERNSQLEGKDAPAPVPSAVAGQVLVEVPRASAPVHYINPREAGLPAQDYAEALTEALRLRYSPSNNAQEVKEPTGGERVLLSEPNPMIFAGTLAEHLQMGTEGLSRERMIDLLQLTDSEEIAVRLGSRDPDNYLASTLASEGTNLSGGQRQRLALARALAQPASILVLTEPLNSVDEPSQKFILNQLEAKTGQPGPLAHIRRIYLISTTVEVERRLKAGGTCG